MAFPAIAVFEYNLIGYGRTWRGSVLSSFLMPVMFVVGFGFSVGAFIDDSSALPVRYLDFIVPGMIASTALTVAFGEASWPALSKLTWVRTYHAMATTPVRVTDIVGGELLWVLFRVITTSIVFLTVTTVFGAVHSIWALTVPLIAGVLGLSAAAPLYAFSCTVSSDRYFPLLMRFTILPMTLFAGVFFPVDTLPVGLRPLAYISPLWHGVELCRLATLGIGQPWAVPLHLAYLALWVGAGYLLTIRVLRRKLVQ